MTHYNCLQADHKSEPPAMQLARVADVLRLLAYRVAREAQDERLETLTRKHATELVYDLVTIAHKRPPQRFVRLGDDGTQPTTAMCVCAPARGLTGHIYELPAQTQTRDTKPEAHTYHIAHCLRRNRHPTQTPDK